MAEELRKVVPVLWEPPSTDAAKGGDTGTLTGWASVYNYPDFDDEVVLPGALRRTIDHWKASKGQRVITLTEDHDNTVGGVIGSLVGAEDSPFGLKTTFKFSSTQKAQDTRTKAREGHLNGLSIYGPIIDSIRVNFAGKMLRGLRELGLFSVGVTALPVNTRALILKAASRVTEASWDPTKTRYTSDQWARACVADDALPIREPDGTINRHGLTAALAGLAELDLAQKSRAAAALVKVYREDLNEEPPAELTGVGSSAVAEDWAVSMRAALAITVPIVQKAAVDALVGMYPGKTPGQSSQGEESTAPVTGSVAKSMATEDSERVNAAARYAVELVEPGPGEESPPGGDPSSTSLADLLASIDVMGQDAELDELERQLREIRGE